MSSNHFDVIVIGVGSMGSSTCWNLASRGCRVLGLEQFDIVHDKGSHTGQSRIIRKAYFEHPDYVPLLERSYENWAAFEHDAKSIILHKTGIIYMGKENSETISGTRRSAALYNIPLNILSIDRARNQYPAFKIPDTFDVFLEPDAGFVLPERAIQAYSDEAIRRGATIKTRVTVNRWAKERHTIKVFTNSGDFTCDKLIITAGSWSSRIIPSLNAKLEVTKQILAWVQPTKQDHFSLEKFPCWFVDDPQRGLFYGFPLSTQSEYDSPIGLKLAHHQRGAMVDPDNVDHTIPHDAEENIRYLLNTYLPELSNCPISYRQCLYTYSKDSDFIIDHLPGYDKQVTIACGFSGHGFKFVSVVGEILADLALTGRTDLPIDFLKLARFKNQ